MLLHGPQTLSRRLGHLRAYCLFALRQVTELAAAVHKLNQDKCQLENQMEMEEVRMVLLQPRLFAAEKGS